MRHLALFFLFENANLEKRNFYEQKGKMSKGEMKDYNFDHKNKHKCIQEFSGTSSNFHPQQPNRNASRMPETFLPQSSVAI
jgi:hypothetical protein